MAQIGISVDILGHGKIYTDRSGSAQCRRRKDNAFAASQSNPQCYGLVAFNPDRPTATCDVCDQVYEVILSG